jgi:hypothetical protein
MFHLKDTIIVDGAKRDRAVWPGKLSFRSDLPHIRLMFIQVIWYIKSLSWTTLETPHATPVACLTTLVLIP